MASILTLVVDDEPIARKVLREELDEISGVEIVGEAESGVQALDLIHRLKPDLVLLDLQMPEMGGFEVIRNLEDAPPAVVIVTAYDQHAIQAFESGAVDYLLKPVGRPRLASCIERIRQLQANRALAATQAIKLREIAQQTPAPRSSKIVGRLGEEYHLLDSTQVLAFQAERELVWIITRKQRYLATQPLKTIHQKLADLMFARIHRNALVNLDHVAKLAPLSSQRWLLTLNNQQEFVVSKRQAREVRKLLRW